MQKLKQAIIKTISDSDRKMQPLEVARILSKSMDVPVKTVKRAMNELVLEGRVEFTYYGQSFIELPLSLSRKDRHSPDSPGSGLNS